jgi:hypothetical protein
MTTVLFYLALFVGTVLIAYAAHRYIPSYIIASLLTGIAVPSVLIGGHSLYRGYVDSWASVAAVTSGSFALLTGLAVGVPFLIRRRQKKAGTNGA